MNEMLQLLFMPCRHPCRYFPAGIAQDLQRRALWCLCARLAPRFLNESHEMHSNTGTPLQKQNKIFVWHELDLYL